MKRTVSTIKQFDYTSKEDFEKNIKVMKEKGYNLIEGGMFSNILDAQAIDDTTWHYTASFIKSPFM